MPRSDKEMNMLRKEVYERILLNYYNNNNASAKKKIDKAVYKFFENQTDYDDPEHPILLNSYSKEQLLNLLNTKDQSKFNEITSSFFKAVKSYTILENNPLVWALLEKIGKAATPQSVQQTSPPPTTTSAKTAPIVTKIPFQVKTEKIFSDLLTDKYKEIPKDKHKEILATSIPPMLLSSYDSSKEEEHIKSECIKILESYKNAPSTYNTNKDHIEKTHMAEVKFNRKSASRYLYNIKNTKRSWREYKLNISRAIEKALKSNKAEGLTKIKLSTTRKKSIIKISIQKGSKLTIDDISKLLPKTSSHDAGERIFQKLLEDESIMANNRIIISEIDSIKEALVRQREQINLQLNSYASDLTKEYINERDSALNSLKNDFSGDTTTPKYESKKAKILSALEKKYDKLFMKKLIEFEKIEKPVIEEAKELFAKVYGKNAEENKVFFESQMPQSYRQKELIGYRTILGKEIGSKTVTGSVRFDRVFGKRIKDQDTQSAMQNQLEQHKDAETQKKPGQDDNPSYDSPAFKIT